MKLRVIYNAWLPIPKRYRAMVLFPFMLFRDPKDQVSDQLFRHEMEHVYQVLRLGWFGFYWRYIRYPGTCELQARLHEDEPLTTVERYFKER
jgi:hypothetical protein